MLETDVITIHNSVYSDTNATHTRICRPFFGQMTTNNNQSTKENTVNYMWDNWKSKV